MKKMYLFCSIAILIFDRLTKFLALTYLKNPYTINQYFSFELTFNRGISWGIFHNAADIFFIIISLFIATITFLLAVHAYYLYNKKKYIFGHVCIIVGSISNLIDRIIYSGVIDFILLSYKNYSWPIFNIADVAIVAGIGLFIFFDEISP